MTLKINGNKFDKWCNLAVSLIYASVGSTFSFDLYFDPYDKVHRAILLPGAYNEATIIADNGEILLTGVLACPSFKDCPVPTLVNVSGYSKTHVLEECEYAAAFPTTQTNGSSLLEICQKVCDRFGLSLNPNGGVPDAAKEAITQLEPPDRGQKISVYLSEIAKDSNIILSHDSGGNLLLTKASDSKPVFNFVSGMPGMDISLQFDGQAMHSVIIAESQGGGQSSQPVTNPYVQQRFNYRNAAINNARVLSAPAGGLNIINEYSPGYRPHVVQQDNTDTNIDDVAKQALADELRAIQITVSMQGWTLNSKVVRPNTYITVTSPKCYLFNKTKLFVEQVDFSGTPGEEVALLTCVVPEVYNGKTPINIFTANGNNTNFKEPRELSNPREEGAAINL